MGYSILDRGTNRAGFAYTLVNVTQSLYDQGVKSMADFAKLIADDTEKWRKVILAANIKAD